MLNAFLDKFIYTSTLKYLHNNFYLADMPLVIVPVDLMLGVSAEQNPDFDRLLYSDIKNSVSRGLMKQFDLHFGMRGGKELTLFTDFLVASGWGNIQVDNIDDENKRAIISVSKSPIASALNRKVKFPVDHMLRGTFAGIFSNYFKENVDCVETKCFALGDKNCEFVVKKATEFNFSNKLTRRQLSIS